MVGPRQHVLRGAMVAGLVRCFATSCSLDNSLRSSRAWGVAGMRGVPQMIRDREAAVQETWLQDKELAPITWMGAFTCPEVRERVHSLF